MRVYNGTGGEVIWYVTSMSGPNAGQFFEVTIPAGGAVILNVGDWANGNVIQVLTSEGGAAAFGSTAVLGDSSIDEVDTVIPSDDVIVGDGLTTGADGVAAVLHIATASEAATAKAGADTTHGGGGDNIPVEIGKPSGGESVG